MKISKFMPLILGGLLFAGGALATPLIQPANIEKIYVPFGFDNNDKTEVVVRGYLTTICEKVGLSGFEVNEEDKTIEVWVESHFYQGDNLFCPLMIIPFMETIDVGVLPKGDYEVHVRGKPDVKESFPVAEALTDAPDDFLYAPIDQAVVEADPKTGVPTVTLKGTFPLWFDGCQVLSEVESFMKPDNVLIVLPKTQLVDDERCAAQTLSRQFSHTFQVTQPMLTDSLLHVRVLNGKSLNQMIRQIDL